MTRKQKISLARDYWGMTIKEATKYAKNASDSTFQEMEKYFKIQATYED